MIDEGVKLTDERTRQLMKRLEEVYAEAYETAVKNNEKSIAKYASLTDEALKDLDDEARRLKREAFAREIKRTEGLKNQIADEIAGAGETAVQIIRGELTGIYGLNYDFAAFDIQQQAGLSLSFTQYDRNQLAVLVSEGQSPFTKIAYKNLGKDAVIVRRLQNQLIQGVMNGESQAKLVRRIKVVTGQSTRQAKRVAQTERNRVQSQGRNQAMHEAAEMGLGMQKQWIARLRNTRDLHELTHLEIVKEGEDFSNGLEYPGDPSGAAENVINCFCLIKPMVESTSPALARHREKFAQQSFEQYRKEVEANRAKGISKVAENYNKPKLEFAEANTIEQAQKHALDKYGIKADYSGYSLEMANVINRQVFDMRSVFGDNCFDGSLNSITTKKMSSAGQYGWNQATEKGSIYMRPADAKKGLDNLREEAQYQYINKNKFWSSGDAEHVIRHELGHAIERSIAQKGSGEVELAEIDKLMDSIKRIAFDKEENDYDKAVYSQHLSRYGMTKKSEFIAESIAEYMTGDARETATAVSKLIISALKG